MAQHNRAALDAMNKNSDESGKKGAKESGKDNASKSDKKDDDSEEKQVSSKKKLKEVKVRTNVVMTVDWGKMKSEELLFQNSPTNLKLYNVTKCWPLFNRLFLSHLAGPRREKVWKWAKGIH